MPFNEQIVQFTVETRNMADNFNAANVKLLENTVYLKAYVEKLEAKANEDIAALSDTINTLNTDTNKVIEVTKNYSETEINRISTEINQINGNLEEVKLSVSSGKGELSAAITDMGIVCSADETFKQMATKVRSILGDTENMAVILTYQFNNKMARDGSGLITIQCKDEALYGDYEINWSDESLTPLANFTKIGTLTVNSAYNTFKTSPLLAIPEGAKKIIACKSDAIVLSCNLPQSKLIQDTKKYSFGLLSDIHIDTDTADQSYSISDFTSALTLFNSTDTIQHIVISGDIVKNGVLSEMETFRSLVNAQSLPVYCCRGNHDTYSECTLDNWKKYIEPNGLYYEKVINGDAYLFLGMIMEDVANPFNELSLEWLEERLEYYRDQRVFLFQHIFIGETGNAGNMYPYSEGMLNTEGTTGGKLIKLLKHYRNVVHFSGHSHLDFSLERVSPYANCAIRTDELCHRVHTPSGSKPRQNDTDNPEDLYTNYAGGEGYVIDVYNDYIILKGFDVPSRTYIGYAQYILNTSPITIEPKEVITLEYPMIDNFTTYTSGSLSSTGTEQTSSSSLRTDWVELNNNQDLAFYFPKRITYFKAFLYDSTKKYVNYYSQDIVSSETTIEMTRPQGAVYMRFKAQGTVNTIQFNGVKGYEPELPQTQDKPPIEVKPAEIEHTLPSMGTEPTETLAKAKWKALKFIKNQLYYINLYYPVKFEIYTTQSGIKLIKGSIEGLNDAAIIQNKYITLDADYNENYVGAISGKWYTALKQPQNYRVDIYIYTDRMYFVDSCDLKSDGTWSSDMVAYEGIKHIELVHKDGSMVLEYGMPVVDNYYVKVFTLADVEYEKQVCNIYVKDGKYIFYSTISYPDEKLIAKVFNLNNSVVGLTTENTQAQYGVMPPSYLIPSDDPQYDRNGNTALGVNGYLLNSRTFIYDIGLCLLVFTLEKDFEVCKQLMNRMKMEQKTDGSFNFSYDNFIGQLYDDYIRTGAIGWLVWGMCYYAIQSGDTTYNEMINKAGEWLLAQQVLDTSDKRYGLLKGGKGAYSTDYVYSPTEIEWCSTEHNSSALQALKGLYQLLTNEKYKTAHDLVVASMKNTLYDATNGRFYQGCDSQAIDEAYSIDCVTWAGKIMLSEGETAIAKACKNAAISKFAINGQTIIGSNSKENYNMTYSLSQGITVNGFKPYAEGYNNPPQMIWTEGTLGAIALMKALGEEAAATYIQEMIKLQNCTNSTGGLIYTTQTLSSIPWEFHVWESLVSSCWLYLVLTDISVLF